MNEILLNYWVLLCALLIVKMSTNSVIQVIARFRHKQFTVPEDARTFGAMLNKTFNTTAQEHDTVKRAAACWQNDLENIPAFLILSLGYVLIGGNSAWGLGCFILYAVARILHTLFYMMNMQPWRTFAYEAGALATLAILGHSVFLAVT